MTPLSSGNTAVSERLALSALDYPVPEKANRLDFMLGGLTLTALILLGVSGIVLTQYYNPNPVSAHASVRYIITNLPLVSFLRDLHVWSASASFILVFAHLSAVFWRRGFRKPREGLWWTGVLLLALLTGLAFTGTVLRADQEAIEALAHATAGARFAGPFGAPLQAGFTPSSPLLSRLYALHVSVLPVVLIALLGMHLWLIRHLGVSAESSGMVKFGLHLRRLGGVSLFLMALLGVLAMLQPWQLLAPGVGGVELTKPFWPFLWIYAAENIFGMPGMLIAPAVLFGFLAVVPLTDRKTGLLSSATRIAGAALFVILVIAITYAALSAPQTHLGM